MTDIARSTDHNKTAEAALVSVIIRTKNRPNKLSKALQSVANQQWQHLEVLVVNDGEALPVDLLSTYGNKGVAVRAVETGDKGGRVIAANLGLQEAQGDYLIFLDDDDWFYPDHLQKLATALNESPEFGLAYTGVECQRWIEDEAALHTVHQFDQAFDRATFLIRNFIPMHAAMFRRELLQHEISFDEQLDFYEDWDFWMQILRLARFKYVPGISACYYLGSGSGFGVDDQSTVQKNAELQFFTKWRKLWNEEELLLIVEYARTVPELRQEAGELHEKVNSVYKDLAKEHDKYDSLAELHKHALNQHEKVLGFHHQERQKSEELLQVHRKLNEALAELSQQNSHLQLKQEETQQAANQLHEQILSQANRLNQEKSQLQNALHAAEARVQALLLSSSWKMTFPLRFVARIIKKILYRLQGRRYPVRTPEGLPASGDNTQDHSPSAVGQTTPIDSTIAETDQQLRLSTEKIKVKKLRQRNIKNSEFKAVANSLVLPNLEQVVVSVIVPVYNHLELTLACLQSMADNKQSTSFEVIVVDDASSDETQSVLADCKAIRYCRNSENSGFIRTCNSGAKQAKGKYLLFLNNDTEVQENWLDPLVEILDSRSDAGIAGSKLVYPSGHLQEAGACLKADGSVDLVGLNQDPSDSRYNTIREVDHCSGAALLIRAELFNEFGGFDEMYAPAYFEDCDLSLKVFKAGFKVIYQPASVVMHHLSVSTENLPGGKLAQIDKNRKLYLERWGDELAARDTVRAIAFYLPQYHPIPENNEWWGKGFTEWTNVTRAKPAFTGHNQPHRPSELGYYDLRLEEVREMQAALAKEYGIHGFCYYYYWFDGKRLLEQPLNDMLSTGKPDLPFCVCWANENWSRRWDGQEEDVLIAQNYNDESNVRFIEDLLPILKDDRYIKVNGRPLLMIYRAELIPGLKKAIQAWRRICRESGVGELYLAAVESFSGVQDELADDFDALIEFPPHGRSVALSEKPSDLHKDFSGELYDYRLSAENFIQRKDCDPRLLRTVMPSWDNSARRQNAAHVHVNATPDLYRQWLSAMVLQTRQQKVGDERLVFINAWNEWAEGNHLEPDEQFGRAYLEATSLALGSLASHSDNNKN